MLCRKGNQVSSGTLFAIQSGRRDKNILGLARQPNFDSFLLPFRTGSEAFFQVSISMSHFDPRFLVVLIGFRCQVNPQKNLFIRWLERSIFLHRGITIIIINVFFCPPFSNFCYQYDRFVVHLQRKNFLFRLSHFCERCFRQKKLLNLAGVSLNV